MLAITLLLPCAFAGAADARAATSRSETVPSRAINTPALLFIDTSFENASPVWYDSMPDGTIRVHLLYDHERASPNRAAGHIHFLLHTIPGSSLTLEFTNLDNVWNGKPGSVAEELKTVVVSTNGRDWTPRAMELLPQSSSQNSTPGSSRRKEAQTLSENPPADRSQSLLTSAATGLQTGAPKRVRLTVESPGPRLYVARVEPYRLSDLDRLIAHLRTNPLVQITPIGQTVQGRELEILRLGRPRAPYRVFLRARAHPWEAGGNWVLEGLIHRLLREDAEAQRYLQRYCVYILPMANKDGVARGLTRFNLQGKDLNRDWDRPADPQLAPENAALERWLERMIKGDQRPHLALELHNDGSGLLHLSRPPVAGLHRHLERMAVFEQLLRQHTWFTEGSTKPSFSNSGTLGDGWLERYGVDAVVHEFNCNWIAGLKDHPSARHWREYGEQLATVFYEYFDTVKP